MSNRAKLIIDRHGPWRIYQQAVQPGWEPLGTVQRGMEIGALMRHAATGNLCMMRAGAVSMLDQRKAQAALDHGNQ